LVGIFCLGLGLPAFGWTPEMQRRIADEAARLGPRDLYRQIDKHRPEFEQGALAPFSDRDPGRHSRNPDGSGTLDKTVTEEAAAAIAAIRDHRPFAEIVGRLGRVSHYVADANNPLAVSNQDAEEGRYFADFLIYAESAEPRLPLVFYGLPRGWDRRPDLSALVRDAFSRSRGFYPAIGREYRRIDFGSGRALFDDRSSAFAIASLAFSHAVTDAAIALRTIWLQAGGGDERSHLPTAGEGILTVPKSDERADRRQGR
jgi:hypothetical protein